MQENEIKIEKIFRYTGKIEVLTGLLIGGTEGPIKIGGVDREPISVNGKPYIPGSSLKGKLRAVLSYKRGENDEKVNLLFGKGASKENEYNASRVIVRDCFLSEEWKTKPSSELYEIKTETAIDKKTGTVKTGALRTYKRIKPGVIFDMEIILHVLNDSKIDEKTSTKLLEEAITLLNENYLGGSGSRGYGKVKISILKVEEVKVS